MATQYRHYAKSQKGDDAVTPLKKRYHAMRLALEANRIAVGVGTPLVFFPDGPERDWLLALRTNPDTMTQEAFVERFHQLLEPTRSNLHGYPPETDVAAMEPALVQLRMGQLAQLPQPVAVAMPVAGDEHGALAARARALLQRAGLADCPLLFVGRSGSTLHGMRPGPADDVIGVFVGPLARALGFETNQLRRVSEWQGQVLVQTNAKGDKRNDNNARGVVLYEVSTALSLLLCGSRRLIEQLWAPPAELAEDATFEAMLRCCRVSCALTMFAVCRPSGGAMLCCVFAIRCAAKPPSSIGAALRGVRGPRSSCINARSWSVVRWT